MFSRWSGKAVHISPGRAGSAGATEAADTGTKSHTNVKLGRIISFALGFTIKTPVDHEEASTSVRPTTTPSSSVKLLEGSTSEQDPGRMPKSDRTEHGATISLSGGSTKSSKMLSHEEQVSVGVTVTLIDLPPTIAPFASPADVASTIAGLP